MWSVGCILAEIATNQVLFDGDSEVEQLFKILSLTGSYDSDTTQILQKSESECKGTPMPKWERIDFVKMITVKGYFEKLAMTAVHSNRIKSIERLMELNHVIGADGLDLL